MPRGAPGTLWRHIVVDLWKLMLVSTAVITVVIAFASTVKPLADGKLSALDAVKFMLYAIPPMLAYSLPFAACFASTMVYHRLAVDNEASAAAAGGVSHKALLTPAIVTGVVIAIALASLNEQIIPRFLRSMQQLITVDVAKLLRNSVDRGDPVLLGGKWIYADHALPVDAPLPQGSTRVIDQFVLQHVVVIEVGPDAVPIASSTAESAYVVLVQSDDAANPGQRTARTRVLIKPTGVRRESTRDRALVDVAPVISADVPDAFQDNVKFLTWGELRALRTQPERMNWIDRPRRALALEIARVLVVDDLAATLAAGRPVELRDPAGRTIRVSASGLRHLPTDPPGVHEFSSVTGTVEILRVDADAATRNLKIVANFARLVPTASDDPAAETIQYRLDLLGARVSSQAQGEEGGERKEMTLGGLTPATDILVRSRLLNVPAILDAAAKLSGTAGDKGPVVRSAANLRSLESVLQREITSKQHERIALATACMIMIVTGAVTALRLSLRLPLMVYLWSFFPALICVVTISGGQQTTEAVGTAGLFLLWGGVAMLGIYTAWSYRVVAKH
ncbi:MAG: LptF/LptG family permease [Planctomycetota bacterium]